MLEQIARRSDDPDSVRIKALLLAYGSAAVQALNAEAFTVDQKLFDAINSELAWTLPQSARLSPPRRLWPARTVSPGDTPGSDQQVRSGSLPPGADQA